MCMDERPSTHQANTPPDDTDRTDGDLSDLLEELRIMLPGTQMLTAFLIILPFNEGFAEIGEREQIVYVITFLCSLTALVCFTAPAAHHRLQRPLRDRIAFKNHATKFMIAGLVPLSIALVLACQLVLSTVLGGSWIPWLFAGAFGLGIGFLWWIYPRLTRDQVSE